MQYSRGRGLAEKSIEEQIWEGLSGLSSFVAENVAGIGRFWAKLLALQQALRTGPQAADMPAALSAHANSLDEFCEEDAPRLFVALCHPYKPVSKASTSLPSLFNLALDFLLSLLP